MYHPPSDGAKTGLEVQVEGDVVVEAGGTRVTLVLPAVMPVGQGEPRDDANPPAKP